LGSTVDFKTYCFVRTELEKYSFLSKWNSKVYEC